MFPEWLEFFWDELRMLHRLIYADWETPPEAMAFECPFGDVLARIQGLLPGVMAGKAAALGDPAGAPEAFWDACLALYLLIPALVNVALNYKICLEQGLPLHPTYYFELGEQGRFHTEHAPSLVRQAQTLFLASIAMARAVYALEAHCLGMLQRYAQGLPEPIGDFVYLSARDKYTWRASNPARIQSLADQVLAAQQPRLILGAAHGSIMSGLVFANLVGAPLYFVRFSMFKRNDKAPILAQSDLHFLAPYQPGPVLLFDEDVAKGTTLTRFRQVLSPLFRDCRTASVLRHALSPCRPDFTGHAWTD